jgi:hypothetical protein
VPLRASDEIVMFSSRMNDRLISLPSRRARPIVCAPEVQ